MKLENLTGWASNVWVYFSAVVALTVFLIWVLWIRKRRARHRCPGLKFYHEKTQVRVESAREPLKPKKGEGPAKAVAVVEFDGDLKASPRFFLSRVIDEVVLRPDYFDEIVLKIESPGGSVVHYGHVFGEIERLRETSVRITACVDTLAASGGYLMCLPAHQILAGPFAMVGSIGVVSFVPNIRKLLEKLWIEPRTFTAGKFKRSVTLTDDRDPETEKHYQEQLELIHDQFKQALKKYRPHTDLDRVATGEAWLANTSVSQGLGLVDLIQSSSTYLLARNKHQTLVFFKDAERKSSFFGMLRRWMGAVEMRL